MHRYRYRCAVLSMVLLGACQQRLQAEPAVLIQSDPLIKQQIADFVRTIVGGSDITLADNVLQQQAEFYIQQQLRHDQKGRPLDGRHQLPAYHFTLVKVGSECRLQHPASGNSVLLQGALCQSLPAFDKSQ